MKFREMRKNGKSLPVEMLEEIIKKADYSVVSMMGDDGYPYGLAINAFYIDGALYFHGSAEGKKWDSLRQNPRVCVTTAVDVEVDAPNDNTSYKSAMCFGTARILEGEEIYNMGVKMGEYFELDPDKVKRMLVRTGDKQIGIAKIDIEHTSIRFNDKREGTA